jgi:hypothetical protein
MSKFSSIDINTLTDDDVQELGFLLLRYFKSKGWGNPFNYNRFFEFIQTRVLGYYLTMVGGGSDGIDTNGKTTELKGTEYKGFGKNGNEKSHSFTYNGTTRKPTLEEQKEYCKEKIMRDPLHHWTIFDYEKGELVKTFQLTSEQVWQVLWPKWEKSWYNSGKADPRISGTISTNELKKLGIVYKTIEH